MKVLITGSSGYLGGNMARAALERGHSVVGLDIKASGIAHASFKEVTGDITDLRVVKQASAGCDAVFHLAAALAQFERDEKRMHEVNVRGTENALLASSENHVRKFVYASSVEVYGIDVPVPCTEDAPIAPICQYGRDKVQSEQLCREYAAKGLDITIFRPPTINGAGQNEPFLVAQMENISQGKATLLPGGGKTRLQMVDVDDVSRAFFLALETPKSNGVAMNLGSDNVPTLRAMAEALYKHAGKPPKFIIIHASVARAIVAVLAALHISPIEPQHLEIALRDYVFDSSLAKEALGWQPVKDDIQSSIAAYDYHLNRVSKS